jgi:hypothetical protein
MKVNIKNSSIEKIWRLELAVKVLLRRALSVADITMSSLRVIPRQRTHNLILLSRRTVSRTLSISARLCGVELCVAGSLLGGATGLEGVVVEGVSDRFFDVAFDGVEFAVGFAGLSASGSVSHC